MDEINKFPMVESIEGEGKIYKVTIDKMENGMWFRNLLHKLGYEVIDRSHSKPVYYVRKYND